MILLLGVKTDPVLRYFFDQYYVKRDRRVVFINVDRVGHDILVSDEGWILPSSEILRHEKVSAVYNRLVSGGDHPTMCYVNWLLDEYYTNVINRPKHTLVNFSKLWQLDVARQFGFAIPESRVFANHKIQGGVDYIYKSVSSVRSIVDKVSTNRQKQVNEPVLFQPDKGRRNIRVHVLKDHYIAQEILSDAVDYRYDFQARFAKPCEIPVKLLQKIKKLSREFGLIFSGIDFILKDNQYYFLEINPSPGYAYFEKQLVGTPISTLLYNTLRSNE